MLALVLASGVAQASDGAAVAAADAASNPSNDVALCMVAPQRRWSSVVWRSFVRLSEIDVL
jgi:hypothetical protein